GEILSSRKVRRERVDNEGQHIDADERQQIADDRANQPGEDSAADHHRTDKAAHRRDRGEERHIVLEQGAAVTGLAVDDAPFVDGIDQDILYAADEVHWDSSVRRTGIVPPRKADVTP